jgi:mRNA interferase MazF
LRAWHLVVDHWRNALPKELNKLRPAIVIENDELFDESYPDVIVLPLTDDARLAISDLAVAIDPTLGNGCTQRRCRIG